MDEIKTRHCEACLLWNHCKYLDKMKDTLRVCMKIYTDFATVCKFYVDEILFRSYGDVREILRDLLANEKDLPSNVKYGLKDAIKQLERISQEKISK